MADLHVTVDGHELSADWTDANRDTRTALSDALPVAGEATRWGEELYFDVPVDVSPKETVTAVDPGAIAYWPTGNALCLFWGPTPASEGDEPRAASPVAVVAHVADTSPLEELPSGAGATVRVDRA